MEYDPTKAHLYSSVAHSTYLRNKPDRQKFMNKQGLQDWVILNELSNKEHSVFVNGNNLIFGVRGTKPSKIEDIYNDVLLTFGLEKYGSRFKKTDKQLKKVKQSHKDKNIILTGHSLGGRIAMGLGKKHGLETHSFNTGSTSFHTDLGKTKFLAEHKKFLKDKKLIHNYEVVGDGISNSSLIDKSITNYIVDAKPSKSNNNLFYHHSLHHFFKTS
jgi:hypothetical protein